ncbi:NADPH dehydrogenase [Xylariaceae sp. FL0804]|nr:NADPH dehydrogenase [Xylariaceae sp. FL0804]
MSPSLKNVGSSTSTFWTPAQDPPVGTALKPESAPTLFRPLTIRGVTLQNRLAVAPMCQYSADDGHLTDWHFAHLSQFVLRGAALTIVEATAVLANGRISPEDSGLWKDSQIAPLRRIADFAHSQGQKLGVQLGHAGRKASMVAPWLSRASVAAPDAGGWPDDVWAPSAIPYADGFPMPREMTSAQVGEVVRAFGDATRRAVAAGVDLVEIHAAHGYLLTEFLSPLSNRREDRYGGSFENRVRLLLEVVAACRAAMPESMPLFVRVSATEWMEHAVAPGASWDMDQTLRLARLLPPLGVDLLDVSSGANSAEQKIDLHPYYQVDLAGRIREDLKSAGLHGEPGSSSSGAKMLIGAVGLITDAEMARSVVQEGKDATDGSSAATHDTVEVADATGRVTQADLVLAARQFLREPEWPLRIAHQLGVPVAWPKQYLRSEWHRNTKI